MREKGRKRKKRNKRPREEKKHPHMLGCECQSYDIAGQKDQNPAEGIPQPGPMPYSESKSESRSRKIFELALCAGFSDLVEDLDWR
jgi:hypothetical protein